jgi:ribosomal-protein-alanine N-acetyltransferase
MTIILHTPRLVLMPMTLPMVEAVMSGRREEAEAIAGARLPEAWPGRALIERAFTASLDEIRSDPPTRLWGDRLMIAKEGEPRVVGSVVFHGKPGDDGIAEVAYGVEERSQGLGLATEATLASVRWALTQPDVHVVRATTLPWHRASIRVIEKLGMTRCGTREHDLLGELLVFEVRGADLGETTAAEGARNG